MDQTPVPRRPARLLVVENQEHFTIGLGRDLMNANVRMSLAETPDQVERLLLEDFFDLAVIDMDTPHMDAVSVLNRIRSKRPATKVIVITECGDDDLWLEFLNAGAADLLQKPLRPRDLERFLIAS